MVSVFDSISPNATSLGYILRCGLVCSNRKPKNHPLCGYASKVIQKNLQSCRIRFSSLILQLWSFNLEIAILIDYNLFVSSKALWHSPNGRFRFFFRKLEITVGKYYNIIKIRCNRIIISPQNAGAAGHRAFIFF